MTCWEAHDVLSWVGELNRKRFWFYKAVLKEIRFQCVWLRRFLIKNDLIDEFNLKDDLEMSRDDWMMTKEMIWRMMNQEY